MNMRSEIELLEAVQEALSALPDVHVLSAQDHFLIGRHRHDRLITAEVKGQPVRFLIEAKAYGYPRDAQHAADQLAFAQHESGTLEVAPLFVAPAISEGSREYLRKRKIGYWDFSGSLYLELPWAFYFIDRPVPQGGARKVRNIFKGNTAQVVHAMLLDPQRLWHVHELAERAEVSPSTVHQVFGVLEEQLWVEKQGKGPQTVRVLRDPGALLDAWANQHSIADYDAYRFYAWSLRPEDLEDSVAFALDRLKSEYALTLSSGARHIAPFATDTSRLSVLIPAAAKEEEIAQLARFKPVEEGENITLLKPRDRAPLLFRQQAGSVWIASDVQLYLDLWSWPQRGREQAQHLRRERLDY